LDEVAVKLSIAEFTIEARRPTRGQALFRWA
jgi:hypothetical protein